ncbi:hypothetical protein [Microbacterium sp. BR1]|uniref:hypothetical protein n=1 Tax=Microbacterium sp. BR1 TaxID=1070896 RepID=UPI000C2C4AB2|nr:hypothetical protein [Microbacterium sp. BR1]
MAKIPGHSAKVSTPSTAISRGSAWMRRDTSPVTVAVTRTAIASEAPQAITTRFFVHALRRTG